MHVHVSKIYRLRVERLTFSCSDASLLKNFFWNFAFFFETFFFRIATPFASSCKFFVVGGKIIRLKKKRKRPTVNRDSDVFRLRAMFLFWKLDDDSGLGGYWANKKFLYFRKINNYYISDSPDRHHLYIYIYIYPTLWQKKNLLSPLLETFYIHRNVIVTNIHTNRRTQFMIGVLQYRS